MKNYMVKMKGKFLKTILLVILASPLPSLAQEEDSKPAVMGIQLSSQFEKLSKNKADISPVMIIRFNQENVYFQNPIRRIVGKIDETKPVAHYELLSITPEGKNRNPANDKDFDENLGNVIAVLNRFQVPTENISIRKEVSSTIENQEVHIFVQ